MSQTPDPAAPDLEAAALERFKAQRVTAIYRLDLIAKGATLTYEDGAPIDMASEKARLEQVKQGVEHPAAHPGAGRSGGRGSQGQRGIFGKRHK